MECTLCRLLLEGTVPGKTPRSDSTQICSGVFSPTAGAVCQRNFWAWKCVYKEREKVEINPKAKKLPEENL